ncbi:MAG: cell division protein ZipA C-terminal FtsZ-binding domain-containing protein [Betaproteobacteria bacterium]
MSDLQTSLFGIGAIVVAGVIAFNWWQERQFRRRAEAAFEHEHDDVLMPATPPADDAASARIEPRLDTAPALIPVARAGVRPAIALTIDPVIDYVVEVELAAPAPSAELHARLNLLAADWGKPVLAARYDAATGAWQTQDVGGGVNASQLRFAVQMSNRAGCIEQDKLRAFRGTVQEWADDEGAVAVKCLEVELAHAMAVQLDRFCADVDIAIGVNVVMRNGVQFAGTKIRALAEAGGMRLESDGVFYLRNDDGKAIYSLDNHEPMPFVPEQIKTMTTSGVTFLLDVPRVAEGTGAFEEMLRAARSLASTLDGKLVDDNRAALSDDAIDQIRRQLTAILAKMEAGQIAAGGARALRLFS